jgi:hypothetical protein
VDRAQEQLLVQLADDALTPAERQRALERVRDVEGVQTVLERQRSMRDRVRAVADVPAPATLHHRVAELEAEARGRPRRRPLQRLQRLPGRLALAGITAATAAVAAAVLVLTLNHPDTDKLVLRYAAVSIRPISSAAPSPASDPALLNRRFQGVTFPRWGPKFGWTEIGQRTDIVNGRPTHTVFYLHHGHRLGYTVVGGSPLRVPDGGRRVDTAAGPVHVYTPPQDDVDVPGRLLSHGGRERVAVFERGGRTCVLAGVAHHEETLVMLASWQGQGSIAF